MLKRYENGLRQNRTINSCGKGGSEVKVTSQNRCDFARGKFQFGLHTETLQKLIEMVRRQDLTEAAIKVRLLPKKILVQT